MTRNVIWQDHEPAMQPVDETVDHVRGSAAGRLILEYGDYECPYSRQAFRAIERVEQELGGGVRFCFRHFPLTGIHPHALAAAAAAEAAARQGRFWNMHAMPFHVAQDAGPMNASCAAQDSPSSPKRPCEFCPIPLIWTSPQKSSSRTASTWASSSTGWVAAHDAARSRGLKLNQGTHHARSA